MKTIAGIIMWLCAIFVGMDGMKVATDSLTILSNYTNSFSVQENIYWNKWYGNLPMEGVRLDVETGELISDEEYVTKSFVRIDDTKKCVLYEPNDEAVEITYYNASFEFMGGAEINTAGGAYFSVPQGCSYAMLSVKATASDYIIFAQEDVMGVKVVADDAGYSTVRSAVNDIEDEGTVLIFSGTYNENVKCWGKVVNLIGMDREECIIQSNSGSYYSPPVEIAAGEVRNLTVRASGTTSENVPGAYALHIEHDTLCNRSLTIENCNIISRSNSAIGMGMRGGCYVTIKNTSLTGKENGMFCHDGAYQRTTGVQALTMINCNANGLHFDSQGTTGATVNVYFKDNTITDGIRVRNNGGSGNDSNWMGLKNYYLDSKSSGNSKEELNK